MAAGGGGEEMGLEGLGTEDEEVVLVMPDGVELAAKTWGPSNAPIKVLALHGYMDNAATYDLVAPFLTGSAAVDLVAGSDEHAVRAAAAESDGSVVRVVALDFAGHGRSSHLDLCGRYSFRTYIGHVVHVIGILGWDSLVLVGHSMGAHVAAYTAGVVPDLIAALVLLDGPAYTVDAALQPELLAAAIDSERAAARVAPRYRVYPDVEAMAVRLASVLRTRAASRAESRDRPVPPTLSLEGARLLMARGSVPYKSGFRFAHDPRLKLNTGSFFTPELLAAYTARVTAPVLQIGSANGSFDDGVTRLTAALGATRVDLPVSHHPQLDDPCGVAKLILDFLFRHVPPRPTSSL